jgi:glyoxylase-like metal-dependent hydrolase (beta-lactamase superfamily II)
LISGDDVLQRISSNIGSFAGDGGNPLQDYLTSLQKTRRLPVKMLLPSHGNLFTSLASRVDELSEHHDERLRYVEAVLQNDGQKRAREILVETGKIYRD